mmetsp:Transcript_24024/g.27209  ORF Transcript_24024/g.27209 Transcript_24024/m.27209 type:complete len:81 (+) Transcript_24024:1390-1632(+)
MHSYYHKNLTNVGKRNDGTIYKILRRTKKGSGVKGEIGRINVTSLSIGITYHEEEEEEKEEDEGEQIFFLSCALPHNKET